ARPQSDRVVNARETGERYPEEGKDELVDAAGGQDAGDVLIGYEGALENGVVAARGPHAERVPGLLDSVAGAIAWQEPVDYPWVRRVGGVHSVYAVAGPHGRKTTEHLVARKLVAPLDALGRGGRKEPRKVVPGLGMAG